MSNIFHVGRRSKGPDALCKGYNQVELCRQSRLSMLSPRLSMLSPGFIHWKQVSILIHTAGFFFQIENSY